MNCLKDERGCPVRIELPQISGRGDMTAKDRPGAFTDSLREGDVIRAEVLSNDNGAVTLKTEDGQVFKARLDSDVALAVGDRVVLEVSGRQDGVVFLSVTEEAPPSVPADGQSEIKNIVDKTLLEFANKLLELGLPVREETARAMRELLAQNPGMTLDEAAFLASNRLHRDAGLMRAALEILSGEGKTDRMLEKLLALLRGPAQTDQTDQPGTRTAQTVSTRNPANPAAAGSVPVSAAGRTAPLAAWISLLADSAGGLKAAHQAAVPADATTIPQNDGILQSIITRNGEEKPQNGVLQGKPADPQTLPESQNTVLRTEIPAQGAVLEPREAAAAQGTRLHSADTGKAETGGRIAAAAAQILSEIPEFKNTPLPALERFSAALLRAAYDVAETSGGAPEKLAAFLEDMFTRIEKNDGGAAGRMQAAREELSLRLLLAEEEISRAALPGKAEMLGQAQKLMEHVRALNSIEQFAYMQLPVKLAGENKTAELYVYKKKGGGRKIDPENVNILLAVDLENMGRLESFINIRGKDVSVRLEVPGEEQKAFVGENTVMLHELLSEAGFKLVSTSVACSREETAPPSALSALRRHTAGRLGGIDFTV